MAADSQPPDDLRMVAYRAARDWATAHFHQQPDDRMVDAVLAALFDACTVREQPHMWLHGGIRTGRRLTLSFPLPDEPMPETGPMHPALAAALARAKAQVDAAHEPSDRGQTPDALVALGQDSTTGTIPTEEPR